MSFSVGDKVAKIDYPPSGVGPNRINGPWYITRLYDAHRERWAGLAPRPTRPEEFAVPIRGLLHWADDMHHGALLSTTTTTASEPGPIATHASSSRSSSTRSRSSSRNRSHYTRSVRSANKNKRTNGSTGHRGGKRTSRQYRRK